MIPDLFFEYINKNSQEKANELFLKACNDGDFTKVKTLLTSSSLNKHADIHYQKDLGLQFACGKNHKNIISYLLTSPELTEHADVTANNNCLLMFYFNCENLDMVRYLLTSPELKKNASLDSHYEEAFINACEENHYACLDFLIVEMNMPKNEQISKYLNTTPYAYAEKLFSMREVNKELVKELSSAKIYIKPVKL
jgi:hypothetical protein